MAITQQTIDELDKAIASGVLSVQIGQTRTTYQSVDQMLKARDHAARVLTQQRRTRYALADFSGGTD